MVPYMLHLAQKSIKRDVNKLLYVNKTAWRKKKNKNKTTYKKKNNLLQNNDTVKLFYLLGTKSKENKTKPSQELP